MYRMLAYRGKTIDHRTHMQTSSNISMQQQMIKCYYGQQRRWDDLLKYFLCNRWNVHFRKVSLTLLNTKTDMALNVLCSLNFLCTCLQCLCPWIICERWKGISVLFSQLCNTPREPMIELSSLTAQGWLRSANESHTSARLQDAKTWNLAELRNIKHDVIVIDNCHEWMNEYMQILLSMWQMLLYYK